MILAGVHVHLFHIAQTALKTWCTHVQSVVDTSEHTKDQAEDATKRFVIYSLYTYSSFNRTKVLACNERKY